MDRSLGEPLPHQQANPTQARPLARGLHRLAPARRAPAFIPGRNRRSHAVLARVSSGYPPLVGGFLRVTHPSATLLVPEGTFSFDLHVLGLPPTFNLSHDQTLQLKRFLGSAETNATTAPKTSLPRLFRSRAPTRMACFVVNERARASRGPRGAHYTRQGAAGKQPSPLISATREHCPTRQASARRAGPQPVTRARQDASSFCPSGSGGSGRNARSPATVRPRDLPSVGRSRARPCSAPTCAQRSATGPAASAP